MTNLSLPRSWYLQGWPNQLLLFALAMALFLPGTASLPLMDRDEPRFAQATREMIERGDWLIPYFNDEYRFDKPVLSYWWMRANYALFGKSEFSARLHSVIAAWWIALVIQKLGRFLFSRSAGFLAAVSWLTCLQVMIHSRLCVADMPMILGIVLSLWAICQLLVPEDEPAKFGPWFWVLAGGQILGFLAKGPIALFVPLLGLILARFVIFRSSIPWKRLQLAPLIGIILAGVALWGIPALIATKGAFWEVGIGTHVVERGTGALNGRIPVIGYYLVTAFLSLLPWSAFFPVAFRGDDRRSLGVAILMGVFLAPFVIFTPYSTQLPHYVLPGFPAFFLLLMRFGELPKPANASVRVNWGLSRLGVWTLISAPLIWLLLPQMIETGKHGAPLATLGILGLGAFVWGLSRSWFWSVVALIGLPGLLAIGAVLSIDFSGPIAPLKVVFLAGGGIFLAMALAAVAMRTRKLALIVATFAIGIALVPVMTKTLRENHPVIAMTELWGDTREPDRAYRAWTYTEPSLVYYAGQSWEMRSGSKTLVTATKWLDQRPESRTGVFLLREWKLDDSLKSFVRTGSWPTQPSLDLEAEVRSIVNLEGHRAEVVRGVNIARSSWVEILLVLPEAKP